MVKCRRPSNKNEFWRFELLNETIFLDNHLENNLASLASLSMVTNGHISSCTVVRVHLPGMMFNRFFTQLYFICLLLISFFFNFNMLFSCCLHQKHIPKLLLSLGPSHNKNNTWTHTICIKNSTENKKCFSEALCGYFSRILEFFHPPILWAIPIVIEVKAQTQSMENLMEIQWCSSHFI